MAVKIQSDQIQNLQQIEVVVAGPKDANRLFIIAGQFDSDLVVLLILVGLDQTKKYYRPHRASFQKINSSFGQLRQLR